MTRVIDKADLPHGETSYEFEGYHHDAGVSFIVTWKPPASYTRSRNFMQPRHML